MSTNIEQNVVEMQFNNKNFEANVKQSMSTLDKLKSKLNFSGSTRGIEELDSAVKGITFATATNGAETFRLKISALGVAGVTAIQGITNSIIGMTQSMLNAVTGMGAIKSGFAEYQTQLGAIQTIMANTSSKGTTLDEINAALDELNDYADLTIYNFTEMTRNIGTFTAAGVDLNTAVASIKGIANLAAASGSSSLQASTAMYQLSQAIAAGKVQLMDWNSVVNAGMGGELFQNALKRTAEHFGTNVDGMIEKYGSFRESLTQGGWLTVDVLTETLKQISGAYTESDLIAQGYTEDQAKAIADLAETATNAATKVKTFAELWDTIQEAAGSGWTKTWSLFFGDFEYARENLTWFSEYFSNVIGKMSDSRNNLLEPALNSNWNKLIDQIHEAGISTDTFSTKLKENLRNNGYDVDDLLKRYGTLENVFKSGEVTTDSLKQTVDQLGGSLSNLADIAGSFSFGAGFDSASGDDNVKKIQQQLKNLGYDLGQFGDNADGVDGQLGSMTEAAVRAFQEANGLEVDGIIGPDTLSALQASVDNTDSLSGKVSDLIDNIDQLGGRDLVFQGLKNILSGVSEVAGVVSEAFQNIFPSVTSDQIYNAADSFEKFTEKLTLNDEASDKLRSVFEGLFSALNIVLTLVGGPLKVAFTILNGICGVFGTSLFDVLADIGSGITDINNFITNFFKIDSVADGIQKFVQGVIDTFKNLKGFFTGDFSGDISDVFAPLLEGLSGLKDGLYDAIQNTPVGEFIDSLSGIFDHIKDVVANPPINEFISIGENFIQGIVNGIQNGTGGLLDSASEIALNILSTVKNLLGIHSPSTEGESIGENFVQGVINGISDLGSSLWESVQGIATTMIDALSQIDFASLVPFAILGSIIAGFIFIGKKITALSTGLTSGIFGAVKSVSSPISEFLGALNDSLKLDESIKKSTAVKNYAIAIGILAAAIAGLAYVVSKDMNSVLVATGIIAGLALAMGGLSIAVSKFGGDGAALSGAGKMFAGMAAAILSMAIVVNLLGEMELGQLIQGVAATVILVSLLAGLLVVSKIMNKFGTESEGTGATFIGIAVALLAMAAVVKILGGMEQSELERGVQAVVVFDILIAALIGAAKTGKSAKGVGPALLGVAVVLGVMAKLVVLFSIMDPSAFEKGLACVIALSIVLAAILLVAGTASKIADGSTLTGLLGVAAVLVVMATLVFLFSTMDPAAFTQGLVCVIALSAVVAALVLVNALAAKISEGKGQSSLLKIVALLGVMAVMVVILGSMDTAMIKQGTAALGAISIMVSMLTLSMSTLGNKKVQIAPLLAMAGVIAVLSVCLYELAGLPTDGVAASALSLAIVLTVMTGMVYALSTIKSVSGIAMAAIGVITIVLAAISGCIYILAGLPVDNVATVAIALTAIMGEMAIMLGVLAVTRTVSATAIAALLAISGALAIVALIFVAMNKLDCAPSLETALALSIVLIAMAAVLAILTAIGPASAGALAAAGAFDGVVAIIGGFLIAVGALMTYVPECQEFLTVGLEVLKQIFTGIGEALGGLVNGFLTGATENLEEIGTRLGNFMTNVQPFIEGARGIDSSVAEGVGNLASALLAITGTEIVDAVASFFTGESSVDSFCQDIIKLGAGLALFSANLAMVDQASLAFGAMAAQALANTIATIPPEGGAADFIYGTRDIDGFCENIIKISKAMCDFSANLSGVDQASLSLGTAAAMGLASMVSAIPSEGGVADYIFGTKDIQGFVNNIPAFGDGLAAFAESITGLTASETDVANASSLAQSIAAMNDVVPTTGGIAGMLFGDKDMGEFGTNAGEFGAGLAAFATSIAGITVPENIDSISPITDMLSDMDGIIGREGGLIDKLTGTVNYEGFSENAGAFASGINTFATNLSSFPSDVSYENVKTCADALSNINEIIPTTGGLAGMLFGEKNLGEFGTNAGTFGIGITAFAAACKNFPSNVDFTGMDACVDALKGMGEVVGTTGGLVGDFITWVNGDINYGTFAEHAKSYIGSIVGFATEAKNIPEDAEEKMGIVATITDVFSKMGSIVSGGEWWQQLLNFFTQNNDYTAFKDNAANYAEAITEFAKSCRDIPDNINFEAVTNCSQALADMGNIVANNPTGIDFWGNNRFDSLTENAKAFAGSLKGFATECVGIDTSGLEGAKTASGTLLELTQSEVFNKGDQLVDFGSKVASFGGKLGDFQNNSKSFDAARVESIVTSLTSLKSLADSGTNFDSIDLSGMSSALTDAMANVDTSKASESMNSAGATMGNSIVTGLDSTGGNIANSFSKIIDNCVTLITGSISRFKDCGTNIITAVADGVNGSALLASYMISQINSAANIAMGYYWTFYSAGSNMGQGLVDGLDSKLSQVRDKATAIANTAANAVKAAAQIHSPSRVWAKMGNFMGQGLANGLGDMTKLVRRSSSDLASTASESLLNTLAIANNLSDVDIDFNSSPVIRPVVDLSDVQNGEKYVNNMFGYMNSGRINASMNAIVKPASNDDVINALDKLGNHIDNMPRNNYSVGDISYDDGTATARAVSELTRAVRIRRRS